MLLCNEVYDLKKKTWTLIPNMLPERNNGGGGDQVVVAGSTGSEAPPLVAVVKDELYAVNHAQKEVRKYDKKPNVWSRVENLPERCSSENGWGMAFRACGNQLVVVGGPMFSSVGVIEINACVPTEGVELE